MKHIPTIPAIMRELKIDSRGYPIPFFVPIVDGVPNFKYQDAKKRQLCVEKKLCVVCGKKLYVKSYWFICGPMGFKNKVHSDSAMHEDCARFSIEACPHLHFEKSERRTEEIGAPGQLREKPPMIFLVKADKFWSQEQDRHSYIRFRPVGYLCFRYANNELVQV